MAVCAYLYHLFPLRIELLGAQAEYLRPGHHIQPRGGVAFGVQDSQGLEDGDSVAPPLLALTGIRGQAVGSESKETPGRSHLMVPLGHVAGLASGGRRSLRKNPDLLQKEADAMLGGGVHLPLGVVHAHVAGLAGLGLPGLFDRKKMSGMACVTGSETVASSSILQLLDLLFRLQPQLMATSASLHPFGKSNGLGMRCGHGFHDGPGKSMLPSRKLVHLGWVAAPASLGCRDPVHSSHVVGVVVPLAMTGGASYADLGVPAEPPIRHHTGGFLFMA